MISFEVEGGKEKKPLPSFPGFHSSFLSLLRLPQESEEADGDGGGRKIKNEDCEGRREGGSEREEKKEVRWRVTL